MYKQIMYSPTMYGTNQTSLKTHVPTTMNQKTKYQCTNIYALKTMTYTACFQTTISKNHLSSKEIQPISYGLIIKPPFLFYHLRDILMR